MKVACQKCNRIIDTDGDKKGNAAYHFNIDIDDEPHISADIHTNKRGYLCYTCMTEIGKRLGLL
jgi:hypothetical protein